MNIGSRRLGGAVFLRMGLLAAAVLLLAAIAAGPARAADKPFTIEFDESAVGIGLLPGIPLDQSSGASLEGRIDEAGNLTVPRAKFQLPVVDVGSALQGLPGLNLAVDIEGFMSIEQDATGTFNRATGELELQTKAGLWVSVNVQQLLAALQGLGIDVGNVGGLPVNLGSLGNLTCGFSPMDVLFTTESTALVSGKRFTEGPAGPGSIVTQWTQLGPLSGRGSIPIFGSFSLPASVVCRLLPPLIESALTSAIGGAIPGLGNVDLGFIFDNLDNVNLGPSSLTLTRTAPPPAGKARLKTSVVRKRLRTAAGGRMAYRVTIRNTGGSATFGTRVCAQAPRKAVRGVRCIKLGSIAPGKAKRATFRLSLTRRARRSTYQVAFRARASGGISSVRKAWLTRGARPSR
jgi:hypothetical protein